MGIYEFRESVVHVLQLAAALECRCEPAGACVACQAARVLDEVTRSGLRVTRWRNSLDPAVVTVHEAGQVWISREYRRSCPGYIVDKRQACVHCGIELARGKWWWFWDVGELVWIQPDPPGVTLPRDKDLTGLARYPFSQLRPPSAPGAPLRAERPWVMCNDRRPPVS